MIGYFDYEIELMISRQRFAVSERGLWASAMYALFHPMWRGERSWRWLVDRPHPAALAAGLVEHDRILCGRHPITGAHEEEKPALGYMSHVEKLLKYC